MQEELKIDFNTLLSFTKGLVKLAQLNSLIPEEKEYIKMFFEDVSSELNIKSDFESTFKNLENEDINDNDLKNLSSSEEIKEYFFKSCIFLACIDHFSNEEKSFINDLALKLEFNKLDKLMDEVQEEIFAEFKDIKIFTDSLQEIKESIKL